MRLPERGCGPGYGPASHSCCAIGRVPRSRLQATTSICFVLCYPECRVPTLAAQGKVGAEEMWGGKVMGHTAPAYLIQIVEKALEERGER